jgi:flagellar motor switch/type III secretory pathway protein FliN
MSTAPALPKEVALVVSEQTWDEANWLACVLSVDLRVHSFTVRELLRLERGAIVETKNANSADVPVVVNSQRIGWAEFEVVGQRLGIRITELG